MNTVKKTWGIRVVALLAAGLLFWLAGVPNAEAAVLANGKYYINIADSNYVVGTDKKLKAGMPILAKPAKNRIWTFTHLGNNVYKIGSTFALDSASSRQNGARIMLNRANGSKSQQWRLVRNGKYYNLINMQTGLYLDLTGNRRELNNRLQGFEGNGTSAQKFVLNKAR